MIESDNVSFGQIARERLGMQCQYAVRYLFGAGHVPNLGAGLRFEGEPGNYHDVTIHQDDVEEFVRRFFAYKADGSLPLSTEKRLTRKAAFRGE